MGRRRNPFRPLKSTKAWPLLLILAAVYWARERFGIGEMNGFSADLNQRSQTVLGFAPWVLGIALLFLVISVRRRKRRQEEENKAQPPL